MGNVPGYTNTIKKSQDEFWYDDIVGRLVDTESIQEIAEAVGGKVEGEIIAVNGAHGEIIIRNGDIIGVDQVGKWHILRAEIVMSNEELRAAVIDRKKAVRGVRAVGSVR